MTLAERYRQDVARAISFARVPHEVFTQAKAAQLLSVVERHLGDPAGLGALDAGCGIGLTDEYVRDRFASLTGTDVSPEALAAAAERNRGVRYEVAEGDRLPFDDAAFDVVFTINVIQVIAATERPTFVSELARVVRPNGLVVVFEHNPYNPLTRLAVRRYEGGGGVGMLTARASRRLLDDAGVAAVERGYVLLFPWRRRRLVALERALRRLPLGAQYYVASRPT